MKPRRKLMRLAGILFFWAGILLGMALVAGTVWADLEAAFYGFAHMGDKALNLRCPTFVTAKEPGQFASTFKNSTDRQIDLLVRTDISGSGGIDTERTTVTMAPGEKKTARWPVTSKNVDLGFFILAQVSSYPAYPYPFRQATCGMLFLNTTALTGNQIFVVVVVPGLVCLAAGLALWQVSHRPLRGHVLSATWAMRVLAIIVVAGILVASRGWWVVGVGTIVLMVLMIVTMMYLAAPD